MKQALLQVWNFLGSVSFTITAITLVILFSLIGVFTETVTESHLYAASVSYHHPLLQFLLAMFFVNIFISTCRRWPFKYRHIPFLMTHLGLLMVLAGLLVKGVYGVQGVMRIAEGGGSDTLFLPNSYALSIQTAEGKHESPLNILQYTSSNKNHPLSIPLNSKNTLQVQIEGIAPHCKQSNCYWIKGDTAEFSGLGSLPVVSWNPGNTLPPFGRCFSPS